MFPEPCLSLQQKKVQVYVVSVHLAKRLQGGRATPDEVLQTPRIQALLSEPKTGFTNAHLAGGLLMAGVLWVFLLMFIPSILLLIGYHTWPRQKAPFAEAHQRAINSFVASEGFGIGRFGKRPEFWQEWSVVFEETLYRSEGIRLIGLTPENGERYFSYYYMPKKESLAKANHRPLTSDESEAVAQLREGKPWAKFLVKPTPKNEYAATLRVIAPIFAQKSCLECHEVKEGTLLGAF
ncbi:MAG: hypothetical protein OJI67_15345, partial [Prosthecobacter sp.]|nr:hypothetical protein [Prosthecobacter sp.]